MKKLGLYFNYWESYDNFIDFLTAILNFSFQKNPLRMTALQGCPHDYRGYPHDHIDFTDKNTKKHTLHPSILRVRELDIFSRLKG